MINEKEYIVYKIIQFYGVSYFIDTVNQLAFVPSQIAYAKENYQKLLIRGKLQEQLNLRDGQAIAREYLRKKKHEKKLGFWHRLRFGILGKPTG